MPAFLISVGGETSRMPELLLALLIMKVEMSKMLLFWMTLLIMETKMR